MDLPQSAVVSELKTKPTNLNQKSVFSKKSNQNSAKKANHPPVGAIHGKGA